MNATLPPLPRLILFLRDAARAPATAWPRLVKEAGELERVTIGEAGAAAAMLAAQAKPLVMQLTQVVPEAVETLRLMLSHLAEALQHEHNLRGQKNYWNDKD